MGKLFKHQYQYSACITDEVNCYNEKAYIAFYLETSAQKYYIAIRECTKDDFDNNNVGVISIYIIKSDDWDEDYIYRGDGKWTPGINIME